MSSILQSHHSVNRSTGYQPRTIDPRKVITRAQIERRRALRNGQGQPLTPEHLEDLRKSGLTDETIEAAGLYSLPGSRLAEVLGYTLPDVESGLVFPYKTESDGFCRVKCFPPHIDAEGKEHKYLQPKDSGVRLYVPPMVAPLLGRADIPLRGFEGEKKSLAGEQDGFATVAIGGAHNFRYGDHPEAEQFYERVALEGRLFEYTPDSNVWNRPDLLVGLYRLGLECEKRGATFVAVKIPEDKSHPGQEVKYDDLAVEGRAERFLRFKRYLLTDPVFASVRRRESSGPQGRQEQSALAQQIAAQPAWQDLIYETGRRQWLKYGAFHPGIWGVVSEELVKRWLWEALQTACPQGFSDAVLKGVFNLLTLELGRALATPPPDWLPCANGVLDIPTRTLWDYEPENGFTWVLPYAFDKHATCEPVIAFMQEAMGENEAAVQVLRCYMRAVLLRRVSLQLFLEALGPGGTGKGTFQRLCQALVGRENSHMTKLSRLEQSQFETSAIVGKSLVLVSDADRYTGSVSMLNALTGEDTIPVERKYEDPINVTNTAMVIIAANEAIRSPDYTSGLARRRLTVRFDRKPKSPRELLTFTSDGTPQGTLAPYLPGLLGWVLDVDEDTMRQTLRTAVQGGEEGLRQVRAQTLIETNPLAAWADEHLVVEPGAETQVGNARKDTDWRVGEYLHEQEWLYPSYCSFCATGHIKPVYINLFSPLLKELFQQLGLETVKGERDREKRFFTGIRLRHPGEARDARGFILQTLAESNGDRLVTDSTRTSAECGELLPFSQKLYIEEREGERERNTPIQKVFRKSPPHLPHSAVARVDRPSSPPGSTMNSPSRSPSPPPAVSRQGRRPARGKGHSPSREERQRNNRLGDRAERSPRRERQEGTVERLPVWGKHRSRRRRRE